MAFGSHSKKDEQGQLLNGRAMVEYCARTVALLINQSGDKEEDEIQGNGPMARQCITLARVSIQGQCSFLLHK